MANPRTSTDFHRRDSQLYPNGRWGDTEMRNTREDDLRRQSAPSNMLQKHSSYTESSVYSDKRPDTLDSLEKLKRFKAEVDASRSQRVTSELDTPTLARMAESFLKNQGKGFPSTNKSSRTERPVVPAITLGPIDAPTYSAPMEEGEVFEVPERIRRESELRDQLRRRVNSKSPLNETRPLPSPPIRSATVERSIEVPRRHQDQNIPASPKGRTSEGPIYGRDPSVRNFITRSHRGGARRSSEDRGSMYASRQASQSSVSDSNSGAKIFHTRSHPPEVARPIHQDMQPRPSSPSRSTLANVTRPSVSFPAGPGGVYDRDRKEFPSVNNQGGRAASHRRGIESPERPVQK